MTRRGPDAPGREPRPPWLGRLLLRLRRLGERRDEIEADLRELFQLRVAERGRWYAAVRHCLDAASLWVPRPGRRGQPTNARRGQPTKPWRGLLDGLLLDVRFAARMFRQRLGSTAVTVGGLALAIGVSSVVFSVVNVQLRPPGVADPSSVVDVWEADADGAPTNARWAHSEFLQMRDRARFTRLAAYLPEGAQLGETNPDFVGVHLVSAGYFDVLGGRATIGRVLTPADAAASAPVVVVNHAFWRQRLGGDESIVGKTVRLTGTSFTVVGVMEKGFTGPTTAPPAFWAPLPLALDGRKWRPEPDPELEVMVVGRVRGQTSREPAEAELTALATSIASERAVRQKRQDVSVLFVAPGELPPGMKSRAPTTLIAIFVALGLVLLLACANVANLLLAGALARHREMGLRLALGAGRWRLARQLLTESLMLSGASGALAFLFAWWVSPIFGTLIVAPSIDVAPDLRVYGFLVAITALAGIGAGLAPARYGARGNLAGPLKGAAAVATGSGGPGRVRSALIAVQTIASIILLVAAGLFTRSMIQITRQDPGFDMDRLLTVSARLGDVAGGLDPAFAAHYWNDARERVIRLPGVESAALAEYPPFGPFVDYHWFQRDGRGHTVFLNRTSADYFTTAGIALLEGRTFTFEEVATGAPVAIVTQSLARELWENGRALGATLEPLGELRSGEDVSDTRVVGIVADAITRVAVPSRLVHPEAGDVYRPLGPEFASAGHLVVRARGDATTVLRPVLEAVRALDPEVFATATAVRHERDDHLQGLRVMLTLAGILGALALGLAVVGVFGVTAFAVEQRTGEIGVRVAVGARAADVVRLMLRDSLRPVVAGLVIGVAATLGVTRVLVLYGEVGHRDPYAIAAAVVVLLGAAILAAILPTLRAARADPVDVLRQE